MSRRPSPSGTSDSRNPSSYGSTAMSLMWDANVYGWRFRSVSMGSSHNDRLFPKSKWTPTHSLPTRFNHAACSAELLDQLRVCRCEARFNHAQAEVMAVLDEVERLARFAGRSRSHWKTCGSAAHVVQLLAVGLGGCCSRSKGVCGSRRLEHLSS